MMCAFTITITQRSFFTKVFKIFNNNLDLKTTPQLFLKIKIANNLPYKNTGSWHSAKTFC